jgi:hypothetical protein
MKVGKKTVAGAEPEEPKVTVKVPVVGKDSPMKDKDMSTLDKSWIDVKWYLKLFRFKYRKDRLLLINMEMRNGMHRSFVVMDKDGGFKFRKAHYRFDEDMMYFNISAKMFSYDFHQDFALPFKRVFPVGEVNKAIESSNMVQTELATNPSTLERFINSKVVEGVMKGQQIDAFFKQMRLLTIIILVEVTAFFLLWMQKAGVFQQIQGAI